MAQFNFFKYQLLISLEEPEQAEQVDLQVLLQEEIISYRLLEVEIMVLQELTGLQVLLAKVGHQVQAVQQEVQVVPVQQDRLEVLDHLVQQVVQVQQVLQVPLEVPAPLVQQAVLVVQVPLVQQVVQVQQVPLAQQVVQVQQAPLVQQDRLEVQDLQELLVLQDKMVIQRL